MVYVNNVFCTIQDQVLSQVLEKPQISDCLNKIKLYFQSGYQSSSHPQQQNVQNEKVCKVSFKEIYLDANTQQFSLIFQGLNLCHMFMSSCKCHICSSQPGILLKVKDFSQMKKGNMQAYEMGVEREISRLDLFYRWKSIGGPGSFLLSRVAEEPRSTCYPSIFYYKVILSLVS